MSESDHKNHTPLACSVASGGPLIQCLWAMCARVLLRIQNILRTTIDFMEGLILRAAVLWQDVVWAKHKQVEADRVSVAVPRTSLATLADTTAAGFPRRYQPRFIFRDAPDKMSLMNIYSSRGFTHRPWGSLGSSQVSSLNSLIQSSTRPA